MQVLSLFAEVEIHVSFTMMVFQNWHATTAGRV